MSLKFSDGCFRVAVCENGHVSLEVLDRDEVKFVSVMSVDEAIDLGAQLLALATGCRPVRRRSETH